MKSNNGFPQTLHKLLLKSEHKSSSFRYLAEDESMDSSEDICWMETEMDLSSDDDSEVLYPTLCESPKIGRGLKKSMISSLNSDLYRPVMQGFYFPSAAEFLADNLQRNSAPNISLGAISFQHKPCPEERAPSDAPSAFSFLCEFCWLCQDFAEATERNGELESRCMAQAAKIHQVDQLHQSSVKRESQERYLRTEIETYSRHAEKVEKELTRELDDQLQRAILGQARLVDHYAELQEKHNDLVEKHQS